MSQTVDVVIIAADARGIAAAIEAARRGRRVLVVMGATPASVRHRHGRVLRAAGTRVRRRVTLFTNAEVVCIDGRRGVEAIVVRRLGSGRLTGVNTTAIYRSDDEAWTAAARDAAIPPASPPSAERKRRGVRGRDWPAPRPVRR